MDTDPLDDERATVEAALDRERSRRKAVTTIDQARDTLSAVGDALDAGRYDDAQQRLAEANERIDDLDNRLEDHDFDTLEEAQATLRSTCEDYAQRVDSERQHEQVTARLDDAKTAYQRADKLFDPDAMASPDTLAKATKHYRDAEEAYETAVAKAADSDEIDTESIADELDAVEKRRQAVEAQQRLRASLERLDERLSSTIERLDDANLDRATLEAIRNDLEDTSQRLSTIATKATGEGYTAFAETIADRREDCETALERVQQRLDALRKPPTIPAGPDLSLKYEDIETGEVAGRGGDADVYRAIATTDDGEVTIALKEPRFAGTLHTDVVDRFLDEAEMWDQLDAHDHIVDVVDWGSSPLPWIALEYMDGGTLADRLDDLTFEESLWIAQRIVRAVRHAHQHGITHLDLKPENILFRTTEEGLWDVPKVSDWGLAKMLIEHSKSLDGLTPQYAAPEQVDPDRFGGTEQRTDIYQLGAVFYELFTGQPVFEGQPAKVVRRITEDEVTPPSAVNPELPDALDDVLLGALAREKSDRYEDILYLRDDLEELE